MRGYLHRPEFLERLSREEAQELGRICPPRSYAKGAVIFHQGDPCDALQIVLAGTLKMVRHRPQGERLIGLAGRGDFLGFPFLTEGACHQAEVVALSEVTLCPIDRDQFVQVARQLPRVALFLLEVLGKRIGELEDRLTWVTAPAAARLGRALLGLAERYGRPDEDGWTVLKLPVTQEELASLAGLTRVTATQILSGFRELGLVEGTRGTYRLRPEALESHLLELEESL